eukprot:375309_1
MSALYVSKDMKIVFKGLWDLCRFHTRTMLPPEKQAEIRQYYKDHLHEITVYVDELMQHATTEEDLYNWATIKEKCLPEAMRTAVKTERDRETKHEKAESDIAKKMARLDLAHVGISNEYNGYAPDLSHSDSQYSPISQWNDAGIGYSLSFDPLFNDQHSDVSGSDSSLLIGGVVGASVIVIIMLIFCLGLSFGMIIYWGYSQKRTLDVKRKKK